MCAPVADLLQCTKAIEPSSAQGQTVGLPLWQPLRSTPINGHCQSSRVGPFVPPIADIAPPTRPSRHALRGFPGIAQIGA